MKRSIINLQESSSDYSKPLSTQIRVALEAEDIYQESVQDLSDSNQALDIARSLEDLHLVLKDIDKKTPTQVALIKSMANAAVIGTDVSPDKVIPAMEDISENPMDANSLLERVGLILNAYLHSVSQTFEMLIKNLSSILVLIKQNLNAIESLKKKFAVPDNPDDDIERSVNFDETDKKYMYTSVGLANTFGDLFNSLRNTRKSFKEITDVGININNRLLDNVRNMIPADNVKDADELISRVHVANKNLFDSIDQIWKVSIGKSTLISGPTNDNCETYQSALLLGSEKISFEIKRLTDANGIESDYAKRSEVIQSFNLKMVLLPQEENTGKLLLSGITNKGINLFIEEIKKFVVDLERYVIWCVTTAEMAKSQSSGNIANITRYYDKSVLNQITPEQQDKVRATFQNHIADISNMVKMMSLVSSITAKYGNDLLTGLVIIVNKMPQETPVGSYNALK